MVQQNTSEETRKRLLLEMLRGRSYTEAAAAGEANPQAAEDVWRAFGGGVVPGYDSMRDLGTALAHASGSQAGDPALPRTLKQVRALQALARAGIEPQRFAEFADLFEDVLPVDELNGSQARIEGTNGAERQRISNALADITPLLERRRALEAEVALLASEIVRLNELKSQRERIEAEIQHRRNEAESAQSALQQTQRHIQQLALWAMELEARAARAETQVAGSAETEAYLRDLGLSPERLRQVGMKLTQASAETKVATRDAGLMLLQLAEQAARGISVEDSIRQRLAERNELEARIEALKREQAQASSLLDDIKSRAILAITKAGEEANAAVRKSSEQLQKELDSLLQQALELAAKVARLDADIAAREWLSRLTILLEGREDLKGPEVKFLATTIIERFSQWFIDHRDSPKGLDKDLEQSIVKLKEWNP